MKKKATTRKKKMTKWERSSPVKLNIKVTNHPCTNVISTPEIMRGGKYKCRTFEMHYK